MRPAPEAQQMLALRRELEQILEQRQWEALMDIDRRIRDCLRQFSRQAEVASLASAREGLRQTHQKALQACRGECARLKRLLLDHLDHCEGRVAYMHIDNIGGDQ